MEFTLERVSVGFRFNFILDIICLMKLDDFTGFMIELNIDMKM